MPPPTQASLQQQLQIIERRLTYLLNQEKECPTQVHLHINIALQQMDTTREELQTIIDTPPEATPPQAKTQNIHQKLTTLSNCLFLLICQQELHYLSHAAQELPNQESILPQKYDTLQQLISYVENLPQLIQETLQAINIEPTEPEMSKQIKLITEESSLIQTQIQTLPKQVEDTAKKMAPSKNLQNILQKIELTMKELLEQFEAILQHPQQDCTTIHYTEIDSITKKFPITFQQLQTTTLTIKDTIPQLLSQFPVTQELWLQLLQFQQYRSLPVNTDLSLQITWIKLQRAKRLMEQLYLQLQEIPLLLTQSLLWLQDIQEQLSTLREKLKTKLLELEKANSSCQPSLLPKEHPKNKYINVYVIVNLGSTIDISTYTSSKGDHTLQPLIRSTLKNCGPNVEEYELENELIDTIASHVNPANATFILAGRLGGSQLVKKQLEKKLPDASIVLLENPELAVLKGAVLWRQNTDIIQSKVADSIYGIVVDPTHINTNIRKYPQKNSKLPIEIILHEGEIENETILILKNTERTTINMPVISLYEKKEIKIGELVIDIPNPPNILTKERELKIQMKILGTEVHITAKYSITGKEVKTVCDLLQYHL